MKVKREPPRYLFYFSIPGDLENAKHCLGRAITVAPNEGHSKYMSLAQLMDGTEALGLYRKGIQLLTEKAQKLVVEQSSGAAADGECPLSNAKRELSSSYCAVAELYMTDLCDTEEAEAECTSCIQKSIESDESNPEAWQTKARLHLVKSEFEVRNEIIMVKQQLHCDMGREKVSYKTSTGWIFLGISNGV